MTTRPTALRPLSRDHHRCLVQALKLKRAVAADDDWQGLWRQVRTERDQLIDRFNFEEDGLSPLLDANPELKAGMLEDHHQMLDLLGQEGKEAAVAYAHSLRSHVRFEEELFGYLQQHYSDVQLELALQQRRA